MQLIFAAYPTFLLAIWLANYMQTEADTYQLVVYPAGTLELFSSVLSPVGAKVPFVSWKYAVNAQTEWTQDAITLLQRALSTDINEVFERVKNGIPVWRATRGLLKDSRRPYAGSVSPLTGEIRKAPEAFDGKVIWLSTNDDAVLIHTEIEEKTNAYQFEILQLFNGWSSLDEKGRCVKVGPLSYYDVECPVQ